MFVKCFAGAIVGIKAVKVDVEVNVAGGGIGLFLVGLPDNAVKESEQRIRSAFENSQRRMTAKKVVVNLAPADLRKEGSGFDLPIAVGILAATQQILDTRLADTMFVGELSLDGAVKPVRGTSYSFEYENVLYASNTAISLPSLSYFVIMIRYTPPSFKTKLQRL